MSEPWSLDDLLSVDGSCDIYPIGNSPNSFPDPDLFNNVMFDDKADPNSDLLNMFSDDFSSIFSDDLSNRDEVGSDGSDSGVEMKQEPGSPTSSQFSDSSGDLQANFSDCSSPFELSEFSSDPSLSLVNPPQAIIKSEAPDTFLCGLGIDRNYEQNNDLLLGDIKTEYPDTQCMAEAGQQVLQTQRSLLKSPSTTGSSKITPYSRAPPAKKVTLPLMSRVHTNKPTVASGSGGPIKVVLPRPSLDSSNITQLITKTNIERNAQSISHKPANNISAVNQSDKTSKTQLALSQGKPLVLTPQEFAKLTAQGILKLQSSSGKGSSIPTTTNSLQRSNSLSGTSSCISKVTQKSSSLSSSMHCGPVTDLDVKTWKRQQRMIKNRESASLSRKRKKEYLNNVEVRLHEYTQLNEKLKHENNHLKKKVDQLSRENHMLKMKLPSTAVPARPTKVVASLLAVCVLLSLNLGPLFNIMSNINVDYSSSMLQQGGSSNSGHQGRRLMSVEEENLKFENTLEGVNKMSFNDSEFPNKAKHLKKSVDSFGYDRPELSTKEWMLLKSIDGLNESLSTMCPMYYNKTDSLRIISEIRGWFMDQKHEMQRKSEKKSTSERKLKSRLLKNKLYGEYKARGSGERQQPAAPSADQRQQYELQVFTGQDSSYKHFLNAIHYRNDTFYVVSFRRDQLLVPASVNGTTGRPKMSLLMPAMDLNDTMSGGGGGGSFAMMQIDCEVVGTNTLHLHRGDVPKSVMENGTFFVQPQRGSPPSTHKSRRHH